LSLAAARHEENKVKFIRFPPKRCAPLGEKCPKNQGASPIYKSFTRLDAPTKQRTNYVKDTLDDFQNISLFGFIGHCNPRFRGEAKP
jgi:hypothetical protein